MSFVSVLSIQSRMMNRGNCNDIGNEKVIK